MRWGVLILLGIFFVSFASALDTAGCDSSMVAYWQFENNVLDGFGTHDGGSWTGTTRYNVLSGGGVDNAADFDLSSKIIIPDSIDLRLTGSFTIEMWIRNTNPPLYSATLIDKGAYNISFENGKVVASVGSKSISSGAISPLKAYHVAFVWRGTSQTLELYVNGSKVNNTNSPGAVTSTSALLIGNGFKGLIDEVALYNTALSDNVIASHYSLGLQGRNYCEEVAEGGSSSTETNFNVDGCYEIDLARGECSADKRSYCSEDKEVLDTFDVGLGCSMGATGMPFSITCCPQGFTCLQNGTGFQCQPLLYNCEDQNDSSSCENLGCVWLDITGECVHDTDDYDCGYYNTSSTCSSDIHNLGQSGVGSELCGTTMMCDNGTIFAVPEDECECTWNNDAPEGDKCAISVSAIEMFYGIGQTPNSFRCSNYYNLGECVDGEQDVSWTSVNETISGFNSGIPNDCLDALNCLGGNTIRLCGEPIIKLPGFSVFAFFMSLFIIGIFYFVRKDLSKVTR